MDYKNTELIFFLAMISFKKNIYLAAPGLSCDTRDLVLWPGIESGPPALGAWSHSRQTIGEVPRTQNLNKGVLLDSLFLLHFTVWWEEIVSCECVGHSGTSSFSLFACILTESTLGGPGGKARGEGMIRELSTMPPGTHPSMQIRWSLPAF